MEQVCVGGEARDVEDLELGNVFEEGLTANYLVLLGAPFAGLAGARWIVNRQVNTGTRQKVENQDEPRLSHLLTNDEGDADLADAQYLLFTVVLLFYFFANFLPTPYALPELPWGLVGLTGLSAGTFLLNKTVTDNGLTVDGMAPTQVKKGEAADLRIVGRNFLPEGSSQFANGGISVQIGSTPVIDPKSVTDSAIVVPIPTDRHRRNPSGRGGDGRQRSRQRRKPHGDPLALRSWSVSLTTVTG